MCGAANRPPSCEFALHSLGARHCCVTAVRQSWCCTVFARSNLVLSCCLALLAVRSFALLDPVRVMLPSSAPCLTCLLPLRSFLTNIVGVAGVPHPGVAPIVDGTFPMVRLSAALRWAFTVGRSNPCVPHALWLLLSRFVATHATVLRRLALDPFCLETRASDPDHSHRRSLWWAARSPRAGPSTPRRAASPVPARCRCRRADSRWACGCWSLFVSNCLLS
jgi:hypothetical protein